MEIQLEELATITAPTSENISEVRPNNSDDLEGSDSDLIFEEGVIFPDADQCRLIDQVIAVGTEFKPAHQKLKDIIDDHRTKIQLLKDTFGVRQGCCGSRIVIKPEPQPFSWEEFVVTYFGVTPRRLNQLLGAKDEKDNRIVLPTPETEKALYIKGRAAGMAEAERQMTAKLSRPTFMN